MNPNTKACAPIVLTLLVLLSSLAWADESDLIWSTFLGGSEHDISCGIAVDASDNVYVAGYTESADFPTTSGAFDTSFNGDFDGFVVKLNPTGSALGYATFLGGSDYEGYGHIAVDGFGSAYVTGSTESVDFPVTVGALDTTLDGHEDIYIVKLNPTGTSLEYATYLGGSRWEHGWGIALDNSGDVCLFGRTASEDFPTTAGAFDTTHNGPYWESDLFVAKLSVIDNSFAFSTFLGGSSYDGNWPGGGIAVDSSCNVYVVGWTSSEDFPTTPGAFDTTYNGEGDVFAAKFGSTGSNLSYSTFLGGVGGDIGRDVAVDNLGNAYVIGYTSSDNFPTTSGAFDTQIEETEVFVTKFDPAGSLIYSTFLGGGGPESGNGIAVDESGNAYLTGITGSSDFPITPGAYDTTYADGDVFVTRLDASGGNLDYSTFLGGSTYDCGVSIAVDLRGDVYVAGETTSPDFPTSPGAFDTTLSGFFRDVFVTKLSLSSTSVEPEASFAMAPKTYVLYQNYSNPFNASTEILYQILEPNHVILKVFNALGQEVRTLVDADRQVGEFKVTWDGRDDGGHEVASGLYFGRFRSSGFEKTIKMVLIR